MHYKPFFKVFIYWLVELIEPPGMGGFYFKKHFYICIMSGKIYGNSAIVQTMLINNRSDRRIADKEFQQIFETVNTIESNFYEELFNSEFDYSTCFCFFKNLYEDFTNNFNKKSIYYKVHPNYFINNYKPLEKCL